MSNHYTQFSFEVPGLGGQAELAAWAVNLVANAPAAWGAEAEKCRADSPKAFERAFRTALEAEENREFGQRAEAKELAATLFRRICKADPVALKTMVEEGEDSLFGSPCSFASAAVRENASGGG